MGEADGFAVDAGGDENFVAGPGPSGCAGDGLEWVGGIAGGGVVAGEADVIDIGGGDLRS